MTIQNGNIVTQLVIPLTKIDHERRMVIGIAALEQADLTKEIMDYETAKPAFESWSKSFVDATGGLSKGNLRVMHTKNVAGRLDQIAFNDEAKQIEVCAKITDENEWNKVLDGNYTGFSVGGGYAKKWADGDLTRYTPRVAELSLVDSPCMPGARFAELLKADGMTEQLELRGVVHDLPAIASFGDLWKRAPEIPSFADAWNNRPQTYGELAKAQSRDQKGRFASSGGSFAQRTLLAAGTGVAAGAGLVAAAKINEQRRHLAMAAHHARFAASAADRAVSLDHQVGSANDFYRAASDYKFHADKFAHHNDKVMKLMRPGVKSAALSAGNAGLHHFEASIPARVVGNLGRMLRR